MKTEKYDGGIYVTFTARFLDGIGIRIGIAFAIPFVIGLFVLITHIFYKGIACPVHECLGIYCFLCGVTRSTWAILEGKLVEAYNFNPMFFILIPYALLKYYEIAVCFVRTKKIRLSVDLLFLLIAALIFMIWRNQWNFLQPLPVDVIFGS